MSLCLSLTSLSFSFTLTFLCYVMLRAYLLSRLQIGALFGFGGVARGPLTTLDAPERPCQYHGGPEDPLVVGGGRSMWCLSARCPQSAAYRCGKPLLVMYIIVAIGNPESIDSI
jgi:hypothetical protein